MKNNKNQKSAMGKVVTISAGVVALAAAGYFFWGPDGKKNRAKTKGWMIKMKGDVVEKLESVQEITKESYDAVVDTVSSTYEASAGGREEVAKLARELKSQWKSISAKAMKAMPKVKKAVRKVIKK